MWVGALSALLLCTMAVAAVTGSVPLRLADTWSVLAGHLSGNTRGLDPLADQILWDIRLPRVLLAALAGAALSIAGVCFQTLVHNPLADPFVLGVSSGASLGAVLVMAYGSAELAGLGITGAAFLSALLASGLVFLLAQRGGRLTGGTLILAGVAVSYLATAVTSYVQLSTKPGQLQGIMFWLMGSLAGTSWRDLGTASVLVAGCAGWLLVQGRRLNALSAGDDAASGLGIHVARFRVELLAVGSLLTATVVSVCGGVGFVGLVIPHIARLLVGGDHRRVLPVSLLVGAIFLVAVDLGSRTLASPGELPLGILTAAVGAPFFLYLLRRRAGER